MRSRGLRPIQLWVLGVQSPAFAAEAHRQSLAVANGPHSRDDQDYIDAVSVSAWDGECGAATSGPSRVAKTMPGSPGPW